MMGQVSCETLNILVHDVINVLYHNDLNHFNNESLLT